MGDQLKSDDVVLYVNCRGFILVNPNVDMAAIHKGSAYSEF